MMLRSSIDGRDVAAAILQLAQVVSGPASRAGDLGAMDGAALSGPGQPPLAHGVGLRRLSRHDTWHRLADHQEPDRARLRRADPLRHRRQERPARSDPTGWAALANDPFEDLVVAAEELPADLRSRAGEAIDRLIDDIARRRSAQVFGTCGACRHLSGPVLVAEGAPQCECRFAQTGTRAERDGRALHLLRTRAELGETVT